MKVCAILLIILLSFAYAEQERKFCFLISPGLPGFAIPEVAFEMRITAKDRVGLALGWIVTAPLPQLTYTRLEGKLELRATAGYYPARTDDTDLFPNLFGHGLLTTATIGYRSESQSGFVFRVAGGIGYVIEEQSENNKYTAVGQIGIGYAF